MSKFHSMPTINNNAADPHNITVEARLLCAKFTKKGDLSVL